MQEKCVTQQVMEFIFTCPPKEYHLLTGKQLALKFNVTLPHLSSSFKKKFELQLEEALIGVKAHHAVRLLKQNKHTIPEISRMLDYSNVRCFIKMFRREYGVTPRDFRFWSVEIPAFKRHVEQRRRETKRYLEKKCK